MRYKLKESQQLRPRGGHHFIENSIRMEGETIQEVVKHITDYRVNNMRPVGDPMNEVLQYYARAWPFMVDEDPDCDEPSHNLLKEKWMAWVRRQWKRPPSKVITMKEAEVRWNVCLTCPHNKPIKATTQEEIDLDRKSFMLRRGQTVPKELGFCSLHLCDIRTSVFIDEPQSCKAPQDPRYAPCWIIH